jgi:hypothetical protein
VAEASGACGAPEAARSCATFMMKPCSDDKTGEGAGLKPG